MDYAKLDAALAAAMNEVSDDAERVLPVFIRLARAPGDDERVRLARHGVRVPSGDARLLTARLTARAIEAVSGEACVRQIQLSGTRKLLEGQ